MSRCITYQSGGFTNYGISYRKYSQEELEEMKTMCKKEISRNEYHWNLERCVTCLVDPPTLKELLNRRKENHATSIIVSTKNNKNLFKGDISGLPEELLNIPIFSWDKRNGTYITIE